MTYDEYLSVINILENHITTEWISYNFRQRCINMHDLTLIKEDLKRLIDKNEKSKIR